mmetsp:Transcript_19757/g.32016  ORF Transcript_19757/g.32016 Transcript_19757/m.32016 type:complete len:762 (+) Transcript_19757:18-2303(+)
MRSFVGASIIANGRGACFSPGPPGSAPSLVRNSGADSPGQVHPEDCACVACETHRAFNALLRSSGDSVAFERGSRVAPEAAAAKRAASRGKAGLRSHSCVSRPRPQWESVLESNALAQEDVRPSSFERDAAMLPSRFQKRHDAVLGKWRKRPGWNSDIEIHLENHVSQNGKNDTAFFNDQPRVSTPARHSSKHMPPRPEWNADTDVSEFPSSALNSSRHLHRRPDWNCDIERPLSCDRAVGSSVRRRPTPEHIATNPCSGPRTPSAPSRLPRQRLEWNAEIDTPLNNTRELASPAQVCRLVQARQSLHSSEEAPIGNQGSLHARFEHGAADEMDRTQRKPASPQFAIEALSEDSSNPPVILSSSPPRELTEFTLFPNRAEQTAGYQSELERTAMVPAAPNTSTQSTCQEQPLLNLERSLEGHSVFVPVEALEPPSEVVVSDDGRLAMSEGDVARAIDLVQTLQADIQEIEIGEPSQTDLDVDVPGPTAACRHCGRSFAASALVRHEAICQRVFGRQRKRFDAASHRRAEGAEGAAPIQRAAPRVVAQVPAHSHWREQSEAFRQAMRSARQVSAHIAAGRPLSELPPPPTAPELDDRVECPHCGRRFGAVQAERHIPRCSSIIARPSRLVRQRPVPLPPRERAPVPEPPMPRQNSRDPREHVPGLTASELARARALWTAPGRGILEECAVCLGAASVAGEILVLPCKHSFHSECICRWLTRQSMCALCRQDVRPHLAPRRATSAGFESRRSGSRGASARRHR